MEHSYQPGQRIRVSTSKPFASETVPRDPTVVTVKLADPHGTIVGSWVYGTNVEVEKDATGMYHIDFTTGVIPGRWVCAFIGTGVLEARDETAFIVRTVSVA